MRVVSGRVMAGVVVGLLGLGACAPAHAAGPDGGWVLSSTGAPVDVSGVPACVSEDQLVGPCFWDATVSGDGSGVSFLVEEDGSVSYVEPAAGGASTPSDTASSMSTQGVHSAAPSAAVDRPVGISTSSSSEKVVDSVDSGVRDNYDREVLVASAVLAAVGILVSPLVVRRADGRRVRR